MCAKCTASALAPPGGAQAICAGAKELRELGAARTTSETPSVYFKRQCWTSCEAGEELVPSYLEHVGADSLTLATDYPHIDAIDKFPERTVGALSGNGELSAEARAKILWINPARLYGLEDQGSGKSGV